MSKKLKQQMAEHKNMIERPLPKDHRAHFEKKLEASFQAKKTNQWRYWLAAATVVLLLGLTYTMVNQQNNIPEPEQEVVDVTVEPSSDLKKIEKYYLAAINYEIANLKITPDNRAVLKKYFKKIQDLTKSYQELNKRLESGEINEALVDELITNLQTRLQLLIELKSIVNQNKTADNEKVTV